MGGEGLLRGKAGAARHRAAALLQCSNLRNPGYTRRNPGHPRRTSGHTRRNPGHTRWRQQPPRAAALPDRKRRASGRRPEDVHYFGGWFGKATEIVYLCMAGRSGDASPFFRAHRHRWGKPIAKSRKTAWKQWFSTLRETANGHARDHKREAKRPWMASQKAKNGKGRHHARHSGQRPTPLPLSRFLTIFPPTAFFSESPLFPANASGAPARAALPIPRYSPGSSCCA